MGVSIWTHPNMAIEKTEIVIEGRAVAVQGIDNQGNKITTVGVYAPVLNNEKPEFWKKIKEFIEKVEFWQIIGDLNTPLENPAQEVIHLGGEILVTKDPTYISGTSATKINGIISKLPPNLSYIAASVIPTNMKTKHKPLLYLINGSSAKQALKIKWVVPKPPITCPSKWTEKEKEVMEKRQNFASEVNTRLQTGHRWLEEGITVQEQIDLFWDY